MRLATGTLAAHLSAWRVIEDIWNSIIIDGRGSIYPFQARITRLLKGQLSACLHAEQPVTVDAEMEGLIHSVVLRQSAA